ncbi:MAG: hypothetical protein ACK478_11305 [Flavobacteriales bacterium]|jgi:hypothetical protein
MSFINRYALLGALTFCITCQVGCVQDDDLTNYSPTQALPEEPQDTIPDDNYEEPIDTLPEAIDMNWFADFEGFPAFYGDSTTFQYSFDSIMGVHEFSCQDLLGRQMFILLDDLAPGSYGLNFDSNIIRVIADTTVYDGGSSPMGSIQIIDTTGHRLTAGFDCSLTSFETGGTLNVVNGLMENIPFD